MSSIRRSNCLTMSTYWKAVEENQAYILKSSRASCSEMSFFDTTGWCISYKNPENASQLITICESDPRPVNRLAALERLRPLRIRRGRSLAASWFTTLTVLLRITNQRLGYATNEIHSPALPFLQRHLLDLVTLPMEQLNPLKEARRCRRLQYHYYWNWSRLKSQPLCASGSVVQ